MKTRKIAYLQNNSSSSTAFTMLKKTLLTSISNNKTFRKKLSLLIKDEISEQAKLNLKLTQIE